MSRFNYEGYNWAGRRWDAVMPIVVLGQQVTSLYPTRHRVDGTVAGKLHDQNDYRSDNEYTSDHSAFTDNGRVRAIDFGGSDAERLDICEHIRLSRDPRVKYVIHEDQMFSSYPKHGYEAFVWRRYKGPRHDKHSHVSTKEEYDTSNSPWQIGAPTVEHQHTPMPDQLPRAWADEVWEQWVEASGTKPESRTWDFYREDLSWVYDRIIKPLEEQVADQQQQINELRGVFEEFEKFHRHEQVIEVNRLTGKTYNHKHIQNLMVSEWTGLPKIPFK